MENIDVVRKLIGKIRPIGKSEVDSERFENLKEMCELVNQLISDIDSVGYDFRDCYEASIKKCAEYAESFLKKEIGIQQ